jgi:hypothetical protein
VRGEERGWRSMGKGLDGFWTKAWDRPRTPDFCPFSSPLAIQANDLDQRGWCHDCSRRLHVLLSFFHLQPSSFPPSNQEVLSQKEAERTWNVFCHGAQATNATWTQEPFEIQSNDGFGFGNARCFGKQATQQQRRICKAISFFFFFFFSFSPTHPPPLTSANMCKTQTPTSTGANNTTCENI